MTLARQWPTCCIQEHSRMDSWSPCTLDIMSDIAGMHRKCPKSGLSICRRVALRCVTFRDRQCLYEKRLCRRCTRAAGVNLVQPDSTLRERAILVDKVSIETYDESRQYGQQIDPCRSRGSWTGCVHSIHFKSEAPGASRGLVWFMRRFGVVQTRLAHQY